MRNFLASSLASRNPSATSIISAISSKSGTTIAQGLERVEKGWRREVEGWKKGEKRDEQEVLVNKSRKKKGEKRREEVKDNEIKYSTGEGETFYCLT